MRLSGFRVSDSRRISLGRLRSDPGFLVQDRRFRIDLRLGIFEASDPELCKNTIETHKVVT